MENNPVQSPPSENGQSAEPADLIDDVLDSHVASEGTHRNDFVEEPTPLMDFATPPESPPATEYAVNEDGTLKYNNDGTPQKKRGRKKGYKAGGKTIDAAAVRKAAEATVDMATTCAVMVFGEDWKPQPNNQITGQPPGEYDMLVEAVEKYYIAVGAVDIPAWAVLCIAAGAYAVPRLMTSQETKRRIAMILEKTGLRRQRKAVVSQVTSMPGQP